MNGRDPIGQLYEDCGFLVYRRCVRMLRNPTEATDVTQWTFTRAVEVQLDASQRAPALSWLYKTAANRCLTLLRDKRTRARLREVHTEALEPSRPPDAEGRAISRDILNKLLADVDERTATVALLTWGQGLSVERAAEVLGVSTRTVIRARKQIEALATTIQGQREDP